MQEARFYQIFVFYLERFRKIHSKDSHEDQLKHLTILKVKKFLWDSTVEFQPPCNEKRVIALESVVIMRFCKVQGSQE